MRSKQRKDAALIRFKAAVERNSGLPFGDALNALLFLLTLAAIAVSIVSLWVAIATKHSADVSGYQQEKTLEASREALQAVTKSLASSNQMLNQSLSIAADQQRQLEAQVANSGRQLGVLDREWKREVAQPDMQVRLVNTKEPSVVVFNSSREKPVVQGSYQLLLANIDHPLEDGFQAVSNPAAQVEWIRPEGSYLPSVLKLIPMPSGSIKEGDRLFGYMVSDCRDCKKHRIYGVYMKYHLQGFYKELSDSEDGFVSLRKDGVEQRMRAFLALQGLVSLDSGQ